MEATRPPVSVFSTSKRSHCAGLSIKELVEKRDIGDLKPHACQRDPVWDIKKRIAFIKSILNLCPISGLYYNETSEGIYEEVDGQNRGTTLQKFLNNEFSIEVDGQKMKFKDLSESDQRKFKNVSINITFLENWEDTEIEQLFYDLQCGMGLKIGEIIHSSSSNKLTVNCKLLIEKYKNDFDKKIKDGGLEINTDRKKLYEVFGCMINMFIYGTYPTRPGAVALELFKKCEHMEPGVDKDKLEIQIDKARIVCIKVMETIKKLKNNEHSFKLNNKTNKTLGQENCNTMPRFLRSIKFIHLKGIYLEPITDAISKKFNNMLDKTHDTRTDEGKKIYEIIKKSATDGAVDIYTEYSKYYV